MQVNERVRTGLIFSMLVLVCLFLASCQKQASQMVYIDFTDKEIQLEPLQANESMRKPIRIALASVISAKDTIGYYRKIADYVASQLDVPVILVQRNTYEEVNQLMANGAVDIAFSSTGAYGAYRGLTDVEILAMQQYQGNSLYNTYVIVNKGSNIESMEELRGKSFAFTDPLSFSGHLSVIQYLKNHKELPERYFNRFFYTYNHDKSIWAVANNLADGASIDSMIYDYAQEKTPDLVRQIRIIATIGSAPTGPIIMRKNLSTEMKAQLREIFLNMENSPEAQKGMQGLLIDRFVVPQPNLYEPLRNLYNRVDEL